MNPHILALAHKQQFNLPTFSLYPTKKSKAGSLNLLNHKKSNWTTFLVSRGSLARRQSGKGGRTTARGAVRLQQERRRKREKGADVLQAETRATDKVQNDLICEKTSNHYRYTVQNDAIRENHLNNHRYPHKTPS
jgi:hypothetical protein